MVRSHCGQAPPLRPPLRIVVGTSTPPRIPPQAVDLPVRRRRSGARSHPLPHNRPGPPHVARPPLPCQPRRRQQEDGPVEHPLRGGGPPRRRRVQVVPLPRCHGGGRCRRRRLLGTRRRGWGGWRQPRRPCWWPATRRGKEAQQQGSKDRANNGGRGGRTHRHSRAEGDRFDCLQHVSGGRPGEKHSVNRPPPVRPPNNAGQRET
ncbi:hypothetical protein BU14_0022s0061 [Porphyra umbilicalis]|uniref:Uncharacterized protein n=1 Tax=Porphyra umbilicalis TaxID=2786 RepID=A0A1X6PKE5_PORUM|nr:hypothetical protein BU14_0022s0061 [Porphyra umbilicalis]|eukprot:OSX81341.1 hypothetical protein BU14_0022s0061 [Porphyra umbilicalis]